MNATVVKETIDVLSVSSLVMTLVGWLPAVASVISIVWLGIRIWESSTVQNFRFKQPERDPEEEVLWQIRMEGHRVDKPRPQCQNCDPT